MYASRRINVAFHADDIPQAIFILRKLYGVSDIPHVWVERSDGMGCKALTCVARTVALAKEITFFLHGVKAALAALETHVSDETHKETQ